MNTLVTVIHVFTCVLLVLVVLVQQGKGAEISASFGGSSQTVFGSSGGANFFTRFTQGAAAVFMVTSVVLTIMGGQSKKSLFEGTMAPPVAPATQTAPTSPLNAPAPVGAKGVDAAAPAANAAAAQSNLPSGHAVNPVPPATGADSTKPAESGAH